RQPATIPGRERAAPAAPQLPRTCHRSIRATGRCWRCPVIRSDSRRIPRPLAALLGLVLLLASAIAPAAVGAVAPNHGGGSGHGSGSPLAEKAVLFSADGMRQDLIRRFADQGYMPTMRGFLRNGAFATGN